MSKNFASFSKNSIDFSERVEAEITWECSSIGKLILYIT